MIQFHIVGAQNTGKTYLIDQFVPHFNDQTYPIKCEIKELEYRKLAKQGKITLNKSGTAQSQQQILDLICSDISAISSDKISIIDRCPLDNIAYTNVLKNSKSSHPHEYFELQSLLIKSYEQVYDFYSRLSSATQIIVFYLPVCGCVDVPFVERENRDISDLEYRLAIDESMFNVIFDKRFNSLFDIRILSGNIDQKLCTMSRVASQLVSDIHCKQ